MRLIWFVRIERVLIDSLVFFLVVWHLNFSALYSKVIRCIVSHPQSKDLVKTLLLFIILSLFEALYYDYYCHSCNHRTAYYS